MPPEATKVHSNAKPASFRRNKKQECIPEIHFGEGCVLDTSLSLLFFGLCMLQRLHPSLWYLTLWDYPMVGVTALVWSRTKHQLTSADFSSTIKATTTSFALPPVHSLLLLLHSCSEDIPHLRLLLGSLHQSSLCKLPTKHSWAQLPTKALGKQRLGFPVPASRSEGWPKIPTFQLEPKTPCHFMLCCCREKNITTC